MVGELQAVRSTSVDSRTAGGGEGTIAESCLPAFLEAVEGLDGAGVSRRAGTKFRNHAQQTKPLQARLYVLLHMYLLTQIGVLLAPKAGELSRLLSHVSPPSGARLDEITLGSHSQPDRCMC